MIEFHKEIRYYTVGDAIKLNKRERREMRKIDWDKVLICGVSLGFMASTIYMLMVIALTVTK